jgi:hypothetical protein
VREIDPVGVVVKTPTPLPELSNASRANIWPVDPGPTIWAAPESVKSPAGVGRHTYSLAQTDAVIVAPPVTVEALGVPPGKRWDDAFVANFRGSRDEVLAPGVQLGDVVCSVVVDRRLTERSRRWECQHHRHSTDPDTSPEPLPVLDLHDFLLHSLAPSHRS